MKRFVLIFLILLISIGCTGCRHMEKVGDKTDGDTVNAETVNNEFYKAEDDTYKIVTPYCDLYYSAEWKDAVTVKMSDSEPFSATFIALLDGKNVSLFTIVMGNSSEQGYVLGTLKTDKGDTNVYLIDHSGETNVEFSEESQLIYDRMCEDVNVIISNLIYKSGMVFNG